jgi:hypothetical protein
VILSSNSLESGRWTKPENPLILKNDEVKKDEKHVARMGRRRRMHIEYWWGSQKEKM